MSESFKNQTVYVIITAASKLRLAQEFVDRLAALGGHVVLTATPNAATALVSQKLVLPKNAEIRLEGQNILHQSTTKLPSPDVVIVAPGTFNTVSKIAAGIADNYPMTLIATAIADRIPVILAPSYDVFWGHPIHSEHLSRLRAWGVQVVLPDFEQDHITMAPISKIVDSYRARFEKVKFQMVQLPKSAQLSTQLIDMRHRHLDALQSLGKQFEDEGLNFGVNGCFSVREGDWMLITTTGSSLATLSPSDLSLVAIKQSHDRKLVHWYGDHAPSSETPLHLELYQRMPSVECIAHTHAREITYNTDYAHLKTQEYIPYGEFDNTEELIALIEEHGFGIMRLHGEVAVGGTPERVYETIKSYLKGKV